MGIHYASIGFTSDPEHRLIIPPGGMQELILPRNEQRDPWGMHPRPGGLFRMPVTGIATIQVDVYWSNGQYLRRHAITGDEQEYEGTFDSPRADITWTHHATVRTGEILGIGVRHDSANPQEIVAARVQILVDDAVQFPAERRIRIKDGTDPDPVVIEPTPVEGDGVAQPPVDPEPGDDQPAPGITKV